MSNRFELNTITTTQNFSIQLIITNRSKCIPRDEVINRSGKTFSKIHRNKKKTIKIVTITQFIVKIKREIEGHNLQR